MDSSAVEYIDKNGNSQSLKDALDNSIDKLTKEDVERLLGLTKEEIEAMADLILDTEVRLNKTYSSSKIHSDIQDAIDSSKSFTLAEIGKMSGASYKVVTSTTEMTDEKIIYLLENGTTYDMYIVETTGTVTKIGDTTIDLSSYLKVTDAESAYLKKTEATSTYVAQTSFNNHITDTVAHLTQLEKNKLLTTDNITSTINNNSDNTQVPTAKATYNLANTKADARHTHNTSDITDLSIPSNVSELTNDAGYISEVINTLTSTDTDKPLSANQGKILNDTKLNKTDANKLDCVTIENVSLKEYILTNFTEKGKTYYLIAKTTCTDLPKASNFYITVETPGLYTYKVTAKELNDSNGKYVCTYRTISSSWTAWEKELITGDITTVVKKIYIKDVSSEDARVLIQNHWNEFDRFEFYNLHIDTAKWAWNAEIYAHTQEYGTVLLMTYGSDVPTVFYGKLYNGVWTWKGFATVDNAKDVGVTTITPVNSAITGTLEYTVKNGICYVSMKDLMSTISSTGLVISTTMPKPSVNCNCSVASLSSSGNIAMIYIDKNTAKLNGDFYVSNAKGRCSFSYPVAE